MKSRFLAKNIIERMGKGRPRVLVLTGARQTGKTTLVKRAFPDMPYLSMDDPVVRPTFSRMSAADWVERYPRAIIDEAQKVPSLIETIKAAHDLDPRVLYLLLGSSQILLLSKVKESLAGRVGILELWPLTLPELATDSWESELRESRLIAWLRDMKAEQAIFSGIPASDRSYARHLPLFESYVTWGGMPALTMAGMDDDDKEAWLRDYRRTYLERDVADLASLRDLEPFVAAQKAIAVRSAKQVNFSDLARVAHIAPATARRFMRYLELSYQVLVLPPYSRNRDKRIAKMPVVHSLDPGIHRAVVNRRGDPTGEEFESAVVAEIYKQVRSANIAADFHHLRTYDGREVDLLIELADGFVAIEIKMGDRVSAVDGRHLRDLHGMLDKPLLGSLVLSMDPAINRLAKGIHAVPIAYALSAG